MKPFLRPTLLSLFLGVGIFVGYARARAATPEIDVILWFDTEDYLLPADDDAAKRLAELLTKRGIRATFKVVGEKARTLERRGRTDVIAALNQHGIGYHANLHSVHPTPSEYLADCGFLDGVAEFVRREGGGAADVRRIFSVNTLACYGQPGSSWGSQAIAALGQIGVAPYGVPCYVDDGSHIGLHGKPFWYEGAIVVYNMADNVTRMDLHDPAAVEPAERKVAAIAERLVREDGGGLISIYYHPCEWVHREFWDGVNFRRGANPPREAWKPPGQLPPEETEASFQRFEQYIDFIRALPGVRFVTAAELPMLYPDRARSVGVSEAQLGALAAWVARADARGLDFHVADGMTFSAADQFDLLVRAVADQIGGRATTYPLRTHGLFGPDNAPPSGSSTAPRQLAWTAFRDAVVDARDFIEKEGRVPARVFIGPDAVPPADFLIGLARTFQSGRTDQNLSVREGVTLGANTELLAAGKVAQDTPGLFGGWIIHKEGFRAPKILDVARLQAWTLKPVVRSPTPAP